MYFFKEDYFFLCCGFDIFCKGHLICKTFTPVCTSDTFCNDYLIWFTTSFCIIIAFPLFSDFRTYFHQIEFDQSFKESTRKLFPSSLSSSCKILSPPNYSRQHRVEKQTMRCRFEYGNVKVCAVVNLLGMTVCYLGPYVYAAVAAADGKQYFGRLLEWKEIWIYEILVLTFGKIWKFFFVGIGLRRMLDFVLLIPIFLCEVYLPQNHRRTFVFVFSIQFGVFLCGMHIFRSR